MVENQRQRENKLSNKKKGWQYALNDSSLNDQELSSTTEVRTQWNDIFKVKKENNYPIRKRKEIFQAKIK